MAPESDRGLFTSRQLAVIVVFSSLGATVSVPVGHLGNLLKAVPVLPLGTSQALAGIHVLWLVLAATLTGRRAAGTVTGVLKGVVEMVFFSYHGIQVVLISAVEGAVIDLILLPLDRNDARSICLAGGLSSASNVAVLQLVLRLPLPSSVYCVMYIASFMSGTVIAGYLGKRVLEIVSEATSSGYRTHKGRHS